MYFDFEDHRPDTPTIARPLSSREGVMLSVILHLVAVILILIGPHLPFMKAMEERRLQALEEQRLKELEREKENRQFVFVQPRVDLKAPKPPPRADLSDIDRRARTTMRAPKPTNSMPFARGNTTERIEAAPPAEERRTAPPQPEPSPNPPQPDPSRSLVLPDAQNARPAPPEGTQANQNPPQGVIADAIRNVQKYAQRDGFANPQGGNEQEVAPSIQFDTKGVEFGPWLRRFVAQIRRNWFIPYAAMSMRGRVVVTFFVHKDGRITDVQVLRPSPIDAFNRSAQNAILASNPTLTLPPEYPDERAFFTVTFYFNETPTGQEPQARGPAPGRTGIPSALNGH
jgi:TonB family protein